MNGSLIVIGLFIVAIILMIVSIFLEDDRPKLSFGLQVACLVLMFATIGWHKFIYEPLHLQQIEVNGATYEVTDQYVIKYGSIYELVENGGAE